MFKRLLVVCVACVVASFCFASEAADVYVSLSAASPIGSIPGGQTMVDIGRFNFTVNTADVGIEKLVFQVWTRGNAGPADALQNIRLFYQTTKVGVTIAVVPPNGKVVFTLSPKYVVPAFTTKTFTVKADITPLFNGVMGINWTAPQNLSVFDQI